MWKGARTIWETLDEGDPRGASRKVSKRRHLLRFLFCNTELVFCYYRHFQKPSKHIFSTPTSSPPPDNHPSRQNMSFCPSSLTITAATPAPYAVLSKLRECDWSNALPPTLLAFNGLAGVRVIPSMYTMGRYKLVGGLRGCEWRS